MATEVKRRRGTTIEHASFTGAIGELTVDLTKDTVVVHDGSTQAGFPLLREDLSNVPTTAPFTNISLDTAIFDTTYTETGSETQGTLYWNSDEETLSLVTNGETIELGQKVEVHVKNQTGAQINKGEVVYASGTVGASGRILVTKMIADGTIAAKRILGVAAENIADGADGKVIKFGKLRKINTTAFNEGDILWVSTTTAGAFQNTEPVQADGEIALPIAYVVTDSASVGEIFVRVTPIDENEYQDYDAQLTTLSGLSADQAQDLVDITASEYTQLQNIDTVTISNTQWGYLGELDQSLTQASTPTFGGLTVNGDITVTGTVDGRDVSDDGANLDELYTTIGLSALTSDEVDQLENIGTTTISSTQWGYLGALDQGLTTASAVTFTTVDTGQGANELYAMNQDVQSSDSPTFAGLTVDGLVIEDEVRDLQSDVIENHLEIESLQDNKVEKGQLFPDGDEQALGTGDNATFNTVTLGEQADSANEAVRADREVNSGDGLTGGGDLTSDQTLTLGTPSTTTVDGTNAVTSGSHTHALDLSGRSITLSDDSDGVITFGTNTQNLGADRTYTPTIADHDNGQRGVLNTGAQDIYGVKTFINDLVADSNVGTYPFLSQTTGWNITSGGAADFRSLYSDEIRTEAFVAEVSEALIGADFLTKSRGVLSRNFTVPTNGNTGTLYVEDLEGFEDVQVFSNNDWIRLRVINKSGGGLVVADVYGQVTSYTNLSGGEQSWTFTTDDDGGSGGSVIYAGSVALDYGQSGDGFIVRTTLDSQGSPYSQTVRWTNIISGSPDPNDPNTTYTVLTRLGELSGIASLSGAGLYAKDRVYFDFGDADIFQVGKDVGGVGNHGVQINANNYWYGTGDFKVGNGTQFLELTSGDLTGTFGDITFSSDTFTLTAGSMTIDETDGISLDANNYWNPDGTFKVGNGTEFLELSSGDLTGAFGNISFESNTFTLDAGTSYITNTSNAIIALDTSDASVADIDTGTGFYADGLGNLRIGDSSTYIKFDTTDGLQIKIGDDDLSTAIADIRSDLIDIYLSDQSTFSGIQFLSGQLVLRAGTGNSIASITLDGTQPDVSTISLDADYIVLSGTTIFKKSDSTLDTATVLNDITFIDGGAIVTDSITATQIAAGTITANEIDSNTITANEIASGTITATEIASNTITANEIDANTITASEIASNTITASEISANTITASEIAAGTITATEISTGTITANEIAAGTITANEIDVDDLFAEDATVAGTLTIGSGTTIKLGELATASFGLELNANNYWKLQTGVYSFKVGDASNFISFDTSSNVLDITTDTFDLATSTFVIDSDNNKIALGTSPDSITIAGTEAGFIANGSGEFKGYIDANNYIRLSSSALDIKAEEFYLKTGDIELSNSLSKQNSDITSSVTYSDTLEFAGLFFDSDNYLGHITDADTSANSGYLFRVGGNTSNFIEVNEAGGVANINADTFKLEAGELVIDSSQGKKIAISDDNEEIIAIGDFDFGSEVVDTSTASASSSSTTATITDATPTNSDTNMDTGVGTLSSNVAQDSPIVTLSRTYNVTGKWIRVQFDYEAPEYDNESFGERAVGFSITYFGNQIQELARDEFDASAITGSVDETIFVPDTATFNTIQVQSLGSEDGLSNGQAHGKINVSNLSVTVYDDTYTYTDIGNDGFRVYNSGGNKKIEFKDGNATATLDTLSIGSWDFELASNGNLLLKYEGSTVETFTKPT